MTGGLALAACSHQGGGAPDTSPAPTDVLSGGPRTSASSDASLKASAAPADSPGDHVSPDSLQVLVNKRNPLSPRDYAPSDLQAFGSVQLRSAAAQAAQQMFDAARQAGLSLIALSGYRSYAEQVGTYQHWVNTYGKEQADVASARPGYSEHQTGFALDVGTGAGCDLQVCFRETDAAQWLAEHCTRFGFVLRYPWQQHETTGYWFESWHFRFIGTDQADAYRKAKARSLEDFWGYPTAATYAD
ncbi:M15 family metallopeptidase [Rothia sp. LK2588]|uniref:M15 family metallopeptidase n=1 Tax=Rothia sp. LK2588 TaxID=3114369 RepID=UPI0034CDCCBD